MRYSPFFVCLKSRPIVRGSTATRATSAKAGASAARLLVRSKLSDKNQKPKHLLRKLLSLFLHSNLFSFAFLIERLGRDVVGRVERPPLSEKHWIRFPNGPPEIRQITLFSVVTSLTLFKAYFGQKWLDNL